jgi:hypothetical protein
VSLFGFCLCLVWLLIQYRSLAWLERYGNVLVELEKELLAERYSFRLTGHQMEVGGVTIGP